MGAAKHRDAILNFAEDLDDLRHMTSADFSDLVAACAMPKIKARRLKEALVELGARL